jgi:hypothetical protein
MSKFFTNRTSQNTTSCINPNPKGIISGFGGSFKQNYMTRRMTLFKAVVEIRDNTFQVGIKALGCIPRSSRRKGLYGTLV